MTSRRLLKAAEAIREVVASAILTELRDPRVKNVTVISVDVAPDMREAKVHVSVMGTPKQKRNSMQGLQNSAGFLQQQIANRIDSRYIPKLQFVLNKGADNAMAVGELLAKIREEQESSSPASGDPDQDDAAVKPIATALDVADTVQTDAVQTDAVQADAVQAENAEDDQI